MADLERALIDLVERLRKEIARADRGTVVTGGITKAGNALEHVLKTAAAIICSAHGLCLESELRRRGVPGGAGTYLALFTDYSASAVASPEERRIVASLAKDGARGHASKLMAMVRIRNQNNHSDPPKNHLVQATAVMRSLLDWLERELPH